MTIKDAFLIGCSQILALIPGFSRSGTTIAMGRFLKLNREDAAKFSFYLSTPIILGAVVLDLIKGDMVSLIFNNLLIFMTGLIISFVVGLLCIKFLLGYLKQHDFKIFMWYRLIIAFFILIVLFTR
jgi:undecaprenyl-diphosphatase